MPDINLDASPAEVTPDLGASIDFDLGAVADAPVASAEDTFDITVAASDDAPIDLGFDLGESAAPPAVAAETEFALEATQVIGAGFAPEQAAPDLGLDISFDLPSDAPPAAEASADASLSGASIDFDLALGDPAPVEQHIAAAPAESPLEVDLSSISFDLGAPEASAGPTGDAQWQEVATKLDLAKAYEEMGDKDGARDLLKEVLKEGDAAQQQQAQTLLTALG